MLVVLLASATGGMYEHFVVNYVLVVSILITWRLLNLGCSDITSKNKVDL